MRPAREPALRLRKDALLYYAERRGVAGNIQLARHIKISPESVRRMLEGVITPGERIIAHTLAAFPDLKFEDLFEVYEDVAA